jgi:hypothetical protein
VPFNDGHTWEGWFHSSCPPSKGGHCERLGAQRPREQSGGCGSAQDAAGRGSEASAGIPKRRHTPLPPAVRRRLSPLEGGHFFGHRRPHGPLGEAVVPFHDGRTWEGWFLSACPLRRGDIASAWERSDRASNRGDVAALRMPRAVAPKRPPASAPDLFRGHRVVVLGLSSFWLDPKGPKDQGCRKSG